MKSKNNSKGAQKRRPVVKKNLDYRITGEITTTLISKLNSVLSEDSSFRWRYMATEWLSKFCDADPKSAASRKAAAITKWLQVDTDNAVTNRRLIAHGESSSICVLPGVTAHRFTERVRTVISAVVGIEPSLDLSYGGFSTGASTSKRRDRSFQAAKYQDRADISRAALPIFRDLIRGTILQGTHNLDLDPRLTDCNVLFTVPKSSTIDRVAAKEPDLNMYLQKMLGDQIRVLLKSKRIDLNDQSINARLAKLGSERGDLATIDLSSASDSVTIELVRLMMPSNWFYYLDSFRSKTTDCDGTIIAPNMFSSMGNGFTFELESLLFYAITRTACYYAGSAGRISVYGDDIICPSSGYDAVVSALAFYGFKVNDKKSFAEGPFRESCGAHWYCGVDVKPVYLRGPMKTLSDLIHFTNALQRWGCEGHGVLDPRLDDVVKYLKSFIPSEYYGGRDFDSRGSVVTSDKPRKELYMRVESKPIQTWIGAYHWVLDRKYKLPYSLPVNPSFPPKEEVNVRSAWVRAGYHNGRPVYSLRTTKQDVVLILSDYDVILQ